MADHELVEDHERDDFAGTSAVADVNRDGQHPSVYDEHGRGTRDQSR
jgi:hypothetical protein